MRIILIIFSLLIHSVCSFGQITGIKIVGDTCSNLTLSLQAEGTSSSPYFFWNFDDPQSGINDTITITGLSPSPFPTHTFSSPGIYSVCVSFQEPNSPISNICRTLSMGLCCDGFINYTDSCFQNNIAFTYNTGATINNINWNFGDTASGANNSSNSLNPLHQFTSVGNYTVIATVNATCGIITDTAIISIVNCNPAPCIGTIQCRDTCLSNTTSLLINSTYPIIAINWNFDDPNSGILNTSTTKNTNHQFTSSNIYKVRAIVNFNCGLDTLYKNIEIINCDTTTNSSYKVFIPTAFSPNKDNLNDFFLPLTYCPFEKYELLLFNRWGKQIFKTDNPTTAWYGEYNGLECPVGVYSFLLKYKFPNKPYEIRKGDITLIK
jgi:gliding motility-associated-like protein